MALQQLLLMPRAFRLVSAVPLQAASRSWSRYGVPENSTRGAVGCLQQSSHGSSLAPTPSTTASPPSSPLATATPGAGTATAGDTAGATAAGAGSAAAGTPAEAAAAGAPSPLAASAYTLIAKASATLNQLTGYHTIEAVKQSMVAADERLQQLKRDLRQQKVAYDEALAQQTHIHREMTSLLQRKAAWGPSDVTRFAELAGQEHANERAVGEARSAYNVLLEEVEVAQLGLTGLIRERYQQEQIWSDKIRRASTWWTWGLLGAHFTSFVAVYTVIEPRKRAALQAAIAGMLEEQQAALLGAWGERGGAAPAVVAAPATAGVAAAAGVRQAPVVAGGGGPAAAGAGGVRGPAGAAGSKAQQEGHHQQQQQEKEKAVQQAAVGPEQQRQAQAVAQAASAVHVPAAGTVRSEMAEQQLRTQQPIVQTHPPQQQQQQQQQQQGQHKEQAAGAAGSLTLQHDTEPKQQQQEQSAAGAPSRARDWLQHKSRQLKVAAAGGWQAVSSRLRGGTEQQAQGAGTTPAGAAAAAAAAGATGVGQGARDKSDQQQSAAASGSDRSAAGKGQPKWVAACKAALQQQYTLTFGQLAVVSTSSLALGVLGSWLLVAVAASAKAGGNGSAGAAGS